MVEDGGFRPAEGFSQIQRTKGASDNSGPQEAAASEAGPAVAGRKEDRGRGKRRQRR